MTKEIMANIIIVIIVSIAVCLSFFVFPNLKYENKDHKKLKDVPSPKETLIYAKRPELSEDYFPCTECHNKETLELNTKVRKLEDDHEDIILHHGKKWCFDCHDKKNRNKLHLADGSLIDFKNSHLLCGQCHGKKFKEWEAGIHGKRTGYWNGTKTVLMCANCHVAHKPKPQSIKPLSPPRKPGMIKIEKK